MTRLPERSALAPVLIVLGSCSDGQRLAPPSSPLTGEAPPGQAWFSESAAAAGLDFRHVAAREQRFDFPEIIGGGAALFDADLDGDLDLYLVQSGDLRAPAPDIDAERLGNRFYLNDGAGRFRDVTAERGGGDGGYGMGCALGDFDRDGDLDLYVTNVGPNVLFANEAGRLVDVTAAAGVGDTSWSTSAAFVDVDGDGWLDLYVVNYLRWSLETERNCSFPKPFRD